MYEQYLMKQSRIKRHKLLVLRYFQGLPLQLTGPENWMFICTNFLSNPIQYVSNIYFQFLILLFTYYIGFFYLHENYLFSLNNLQKWIRIYLLSLQYSGSCMRHTIHTPICVSIFVANGNGKSAIICTYDLNRFTGITGYS